MFRTILICMALTVTAGAAQAANANLRGPLPQAAEAAAKAAIELRLSEREEPDPRPSRQLGGRGGTRRRRDCCRFTGQRRNRRGVKTGGKLGADATIPRSQLGRAWLVLKLTAEGFVDDDAWGRGASLAYLRYFL